MNPTEARISKNAKNIVIYNGLAVFFRLFRLFLLRKGDKKTWKSIKTIVIYSILTVFFGFSVFFGFWGSEFAGLATLHNY